MTRFFALSLLAAMLALAPPVQAGGEMAADAGASLAETHCGRCHAIGGDGVSAHGDAPTFRELARRWPPESIAEALAEGIVTGHPDMPPFKFQPREIDQLLDTLRALRRR